MGVEAKAGKGKPLAGLPVDVGSSGVDAGLQSVASGTGAGTASEAGEAVGPAGGEAAAPVSKPAIAKPIEKAYHGPVCKHCGGKMEVTHTHKWANGMRKRRLRCTVCRIPIILKEQVDDDE